MLIPFSGLSTLPLWNIPSSVSHCFLCPFHPTLPQHLPPHLLPLLLLPAHPWPQLWRAFGTSLPRFLTQLLSSFPLVNHCAHFSYFLVSIVAFQKALRGPHKEYFRFSHQTIILSPGPPWSEDVAVCWLFLHRERFCVPTSAPFLPSVGLGCLCSPQTSPPKPQPCTPELAQLFQKGLSKPFCKCTHWRTTGSSYGEEKVQSASIWLRK